MEKLSKQQLTKLSFVILSIGMLVLSCIFLRGLPKIVLLVALILFASLGVLIANTQYNRHESLFKFFVVTHLIISGILICFIILDQTGLLYLLQDTEAILQLVRNSRHLGVIVFIFLVIFQIIFLPIPTAVTAFIGTKLYGAHLGFIFITIGTIIGSFACFAMGRFFGQKLVSWMIGKEKTEEYAELLNRKGRFIFIIMMLFPFFPDDILCLVAGVTSMSYLYFGIAITLTRPIMIAFMCYFVEGTIIPFSGWGIPVWIAIFSITIVIFLIINKLKNNLINKVKRQGN